MMVGEAAGDARLVSTDSCPDVGAQSATGNGAGRLQVSAAGPWRVLLRVSLPRARVAVAGAALWVALQTGTEITVTARPARDLGNGSYRATRCG